MKDESDQMAIPPLFRCPISLDLFKDPVTLSTGQTYDRSSIEEWLSAGNLTCPVTMQPLHDPSIIVPNHALRHLIDHWLRVGDLGPASSSPSPHHPSLVSLRNDLESEGVAVIVKSRGVQKIQALCEESPGVAGALVRSGMVALLLRLAFGGAESDTSGEGADLVEQALRCALSLLDHGGVEDINVLEEGSMLRSMLFLLNHSSGDVVKAGICRLVEKVALSPSSGVKGLHAKLGEDTALLKSIVSLLRQQPQVSDAAIAAVKSLCHLQPIRENLVREGALGGLIAYISLAKKSRQARLVLPPALATVEQLLLEVESSKEAILDDPDGVRTLVEMVFRVSGHETSESAVMSLTILCGDSPAAREEAIEAGVVTQLLLLIQSQCSGRIKTQARMLLKLLGS
ncbi:hypothetical protein MLD38_003254 [Melastoma candidum]|uniref:Uncharacterized protein n=1 Tax=Melastoma candidum TaxID=119954 RepID=A0ACB9S181_9MYRT|nr:hypothetical protein MLD38_003254 [Melastoma candidum]